ncbi:MAG: ABC transporter ATP-binding protein [Chloroflexota bacterium]
MIIAENLQKKFEDFVAVDSVSLQVSPGEVLALLGPNGAGKTTTVRMLTSILKPNEGNASIEGFDVVKSPKQVRSAVGVLTENHGLYNRMRAAEYLEFFGQIYGLDAEERKQRSDGLLERFGLLDHAGRRIGEFSKGMRQKLALARAMMHDPDVLLLDEPTSAMDPESARLVRDMIKDLKSNRRTILICTHNLAEAEELSDRIAIIRKGKIIASGTPVELRDELLGEPVYEIAYVVEKNKKLPSLNGLIKVVETGEGWMQYRCENPVEANSTLLEKMVAAKFKVTHLHEMPRSLEKVYLQAVSVEDGDV